jgi:hypothetical protein
MAGDGVELHGKRRVGSGERYGHTVVAALADFGDEFNGAQEGEVELLCGSLGAAAGKNIDFLMAVGAGEVGHVLDDAEDFDVDLVEHFEGLAGVLEGNVGRSRDDHCAGKRHGLDQRDDDVTGAGRQIDEEYVELAPFHLLEELADDLVEHGSAHDEGLVPRRDESYGDDLNAVGDVGLDLVVRKDGRLAGTAHHEGDIGSINVGVDEADAVAELGESDGEINGKCGFADAAFAGSDSNDGFDAREGGGRRRSWVVGHGFRVQRARGRRAVGRAGEGDISRSFLR